MTPLAVRTRSTRAPRCTRLHHSFHEQPGQDRWNPREVERLPLVPVLVTSGRLVSQKGRGQEMHARLNGHLAPLPAGALAPDFTLPQAPRQRVTLHRLRGQPVILVFYPLNWEPVSREQLALYQAYVGEFARLGASVFGMSVDHVLSHAAFARDAQLRFPLLADFQPRGAVARRYGVYREALGVSARALFVLDRRGTIRFSGAYPDALNPGVGHLLTTLEALAAEDEPTREG